MRPIESLFDKACTNQIHKIKKSKFFDHLVKDVFTRGTINDTKYRIKIKKSINKKQKKGGSSRRDWPIVGQQWIGRKFDVDQRTIGRQISKIIQKIKAILNLGPPSAFY